MEKFVIEGGNPLAGTIVPSGNKNAALPALAACLLTEEEVVLRNIPRIRDVEAMTELLTGLGVGVEWRDDNVVALCAADVDPKAMDPGAANRIRASFLLAGPLLARFREADMPPPGGDVIGRRRLDPHLDAFRALGADVRFDRWYHLAAPGGLRPCDFFMDEPSVMGTENALMAAALTPGATVIHNAASEPHVQDLARLLLQMGARVSSPDIRAGMAMLIAASTARNATTAVRIFQPRPMSWATLATHGEVRDPGRDAAVGHHRPGGQQERRASVARSLPPHRGGGRAAQHPAHP